MIEELEDEILEMRAIAARAGGGELKTLESEKLNLAKELADMKSKLEESTSKFENAVAISTCEINQMLLSQNLQRIRARRSPKTLK